MTVNTAGLGYASVDLVWPKLKVVPSLKLCPGAKVKVDGWKLVGVVLAVPAYPVSSTMEELRIGVDSPLNGVAYVGPLSGYTGVFRKSKTSPESVKFPGTREAKIYGFDGDFFNAIWTLYAEDTTDELKGPKPGDGFLFVVGSAMKKTNRVYGISVSPRKCGSLLYGFQWGYKVVPSLVKGVPKEAREAAKEVKSWGVDVHVRRKHALEVVNGFGVTAGWRAWCVAGAPAVTKKGDYSPPEKVVKSFVRGIPKKYKPFDKFYYNEKFISVD